MYAEVEIGGIRHLLAINRDITEQRRLRLCCAARGEVLEAFHASPEPIALSKLETGELLEVTRLRAHQRLLREEAIGHTAIELGLWKQPDQRAALAARLASGSAVHDLETVLRRKDGERRS